MIASTQSFLPQNVLLVVVAVGMLEAAMWTRISALSAINTMLLLLNVISVLQ